MTPVVSTVKLDRGISLSVAETGDPTGPAVLLLPGPTDSWRSYERVLEELPVSLHAIAVSPRGHGDSDKPPTGYRVEDFAADVPSLLDALDIHRAVLAGHSGSCLVARRVALDHPARVGGLVLEAAPASLHGNPGLTEFVASVVSGLEDPIEPAFVRSFVLDTSSDSLPPELVDVLVGEALKVPARVWREMFAALLAYDDLGEIERLRAPTLLVWGDADSVVDRQMQATLAARIRGAELRVYDGAGHTPRWEAPRRFADDIAALVERSLPR